VTTPPAGADLGIVEAVGLLFGGENLDFLAQYALMPLGART
jgi:hypothetical protein